MLINRIVDGFRGYLIERAYEKEMQNESHTVQEEASETDGQDGLVWDGEGGAYNGDTEGYRKVEGQTDLTWHESAAERSNPDAAENQLLYKGKVMAGVSHWKNSQTQSLSVAVDTHRLERTGLEDHYATLDEGMAATERWAIDTGVAIFDRESAALAKCLPLGPMDFFKQPVDQDGNRPWRAERSAENDIVEIVHRNGLEPTAANEHAFAAAEKMNAHLQHFTSLMAQRSAEAERGPEQSGGFEL